LILAVGVVSSAAGFWFIDRDLNFASKLLSETEGWVYLIPIFLVAGDLSLTMIGLSSSRNVVELNPLVSMVLQQGSPALVPFVISYMALSEGLAFFMLHLGKRLFPAGSARFIPISAICGAASFGMGSNIALLVIPGFSQLAFIGGATVGLLMSCLVFVLLRKSGLTLESPWASSLSLSNESQH
jgi:hypothetical protein